ncbi:hypothetical protein AAC387_Pa11g2264 [Persea americana]
MENEEVAAKQETGTKRKTHFQLNSLENFYLEDKYPSQKAMEDYAVALKLTYKQVRGWFIERRRKEKKEKDVFCSSGKIGPGNVRDSVLDCTLNRGYGNKIYNQGSLGPRVKTQPKHNQTRFPDLDRSKKNCSTVIAKSRHMKNPSVGIKNSNQKKHLFGLQDLFTPEYILKKVFRKDGPPLGVEFDPLPAGAFRSCSGSVAASRDSQRKPKRRKISESSILGSRIQTLKGAPVKKYGIGKGLMTLWRATNPDSQCLPTGVNLINREAAKTCVNSTFLDLHESSRQQPKKSQYRRIAARQRLLGSKSQNNRKPSVKRRKVECNKDENRKKAYKAECKLAIGELRSQEQSGAIVVSLDDEELELRELQAGPNRLTCSHLAIDGRRSCSLCKDLLARFPPQSVKMKQPLCPRPWDSSPEIVRKLFKVFRFLYTHSVAVDVCPFTLDEFAQAFHDKDSLLLGKIHVVLLNLLLGDVGRELSSGFLPRAAKDCRFLGFLHFIMEQGFDVNFWNRALNPLTWIEILRLVLVAAGFSAKQGSLRRETLSKEGSRLEKYGLRPGTLKGELFNILAEQGSNGSKISDLAKSFQIVELNLPDTTDQLEQQICSTLSSDITLFEKISPSAYRLRVNTLTSKGTGTYQSDSEDSGSVDDDSESSCNNDSGDSDHSEPEELDSGDDCRIVQHKGRRKMKNKKLTEYTEIDESQSGEVWVLGLMEGEYSDLSIEEKLNVLVALVDLTAAGSSIRPENTVRAISENTVEMQHRGSGAKLKRSSVSQQLWSKPFQGHVGYVHSIDGQSFGKTGGHYRSNSSKSRSAEYIGELGSDMHPLQSIYLGSDRRYNSYWLFLGPCDGKDPGHRRVYFESSEDGHWEVIDTEQALCALLSVLDSRGARESQLLASLEKREAFLCEAMHNNMAIVSRARQSTRSDQCDMDAVSGDGSSPISDIDNNLTPAEAVNVSMALSGAIVLEHERNGEEKKKKWDRLQAFDSWIWNSFYSNLNAVKYSRRSYLESLARCESCHDLYWRDERHCKTCHTTFELDFDMEERYTIHIATCKEKEDGNLFVGHKILPSQLQSLKAALHAIEAAMPENALDGAWRRSAHKLWVKRLRRTSSLAEFLQVLNDFVGAINEEWLCQCNVSLGPNTALEEIMVFFPTIPQTTSAVALWLVKLDALLAPYPESVQSEKLPESNPHPRRNIRRKP